MGLVFTILYWPINELLSNVALIDHMFLVCLNKDQLQKAVSMIMMSLSLGGSKFDLQDLGSGDIKSDDLDKIKDLANQATRAGPRKGMMDEMIEQVQKVKLSKELMMDNMMNFFRDKTMKQKGKNGEQKLTFMEMISGGIGWDF